MAPVFSSLDFFAVDCCDHITGLDVRMLQIEGSALDDLLDFQTVSVVVIVIEGSECSYGVSASV